MVDRLSLSAVLNCDAKSCFLRRKRRGTMRFFSFYYRFSHVIYGT